MLSGKGRLLIATTPQTIEPTFNNDLTKKYLLRSCHHKFSVKQLAEKRMFSWKCDATAKFKSNDFRINQNQSDLTNN
jgi:hypothetical protein